MKIVMLACIRCLIDHRDMPDKIESFAGGTTTPHPGGEQLNQKTLVENWRILEFDRDLALSRGKH